MHPPHVDAALLIMMRTQSLKRDTSMHRYRRRLQDVEGLYEQKQKAFATAARRARVFTIVFGLFNSPAAGSGVGADACSAALAPASIVVVVGIIFACQTIRPRIGGGTRRLERVHGARKRLFRIKSHTSPITLHTSGA